MDTPITNKVTLQWISSIFSQFDKAYFCFIVLLEATENQKQNPLIETTANCRIGDWTVYVLF